MNLLDIFEGREPYQQAIDKLEQRRIEDLEAKMDDCARRGDKEGFQKCKAERDSYHQVKTNEGSMKRQMEADAERMSREKFCDTYGDEHGEFWDNINGPLDEAGIGQDIVNKQEKIARATPSTPAGKVASTVKNAAKWLAGKGGPGKEGSTYEQEELDEKLKGLPLKKLGSARDSGKSVRKFRAQRGLEEAGTDSQWSKESEWKAIPKDKSGRPVDPRGEVTHLSDVARREAERKADQKKNSEEVNEYISMGSDKNYMEAEPYKNYKIYVRKKPFGNTGIYTAHTEVDRKEFMGKGSSQEEAVQAIRDRIDFVLNAQKKVTGSSTIDFNVKFATDLLSDSRQTFYAKLENVKGQPKLIIAGTDIANDPELLAAGDFKRSALRNQVDDQGRATPLPGIPLTAKSLRAGDWIANGRYTVGNETTDSDGNRVFDLTYHSTAHTKSDKLRLNQPAFTLGTAREVDEASWGGSGPAGLKTPYAVYTKQNGQVKRVKTTNKIGQPMNTREAEAYVAAMRKSDPTRWTHDTVWVAPADIDLSEDDPMGGATVDIDQMAGADADTNPGNLDEAVNEKGALKAAQQAAEFIIRNLNDRAALKDYSLHFWSPTKFYQGATRAMRGAGVDEIAKHIIQDRPAEFPKNQNEDEALRDPWKEKYFGPGEVVQKVFKVKADNGKSYNIKAETEQQAKETLQKHAPDANILSIKFVSNVMDEAANPAQQAAIAIAMKRAGKKPKSVDEAIPVIRGTQSTGTQYANQLAKIAMKLAKQRHADGLRNDAKDFNKAAKLFAAGDIDGGAEIIAYEMDTEPADEFYAYMEHYKIPTEIVFGLDEEKTRLDPKCWTGKKIGTPKTKMKGGVRVNNCVPAEEGMFSTLEENNEARDAVESAIIRRIMVAHKDLLMKFGPQKVMDAAEAVADEHTDVEEIGTSDVSAYVQQVERYLAMNY